MFKAGGYRAMENYLERAKAEHVAAGHPWKDDLKQEGEGPPRQSRPFPLDMLRQDLGMEALARGALVVV
eukprot:3553934-Amphidinium_carterae.1